MEGIIIVLLPYKIYLLQAIEHKPYDHKADVFSFRILMWELLTGKVLATDWSVFVQFGSYLINFT
jgi:hypothetical protein